MHVCRGRILCFYLYICLVFSISTCSGHFEMRLLKRIGAINLCSMLAAILLEHDLCADVLSLTPDVNRGKEEDIFM